MVPRDPRSLGGVMGGPHGARSEQEYIKSEMVMKTIEYIKSEMMMKTIASPSAKSRRKAIGEFE